jgi:uncharacterized small protein (DUF1192 family)
MNIEDLDPRTPQKKPLDLTPFAVSELEDYIVSLTSEIDRVRAEIAKKKAHSAAAAGLFKV